LSGYASCAKELRESVEGKATQRIELVSPEDRGFEVKVTFEMPVNERRAPLATVTEKVLEATVVAAHATDEEKE